MDSPIWVIATFVFFLLALGLLASTVYLATRVPSASQCQKLYPRNVTREECDHLFPCSSKSCLSYYIMVLNNSGGGITQEGSNVIISNANTPGIQTWSLEKSGNKFAIKNTSSNLYLSIQGGSKVIVSAQPFDFTFENHIYGIVIRFNQSVISFQGLNKELSVIPYSDMLSQNSWWALLPTN